MYVKVVYKNQKRKFKLGDRAAYSELCKEMIRCFGEETKGLEFGYMDDDNELIHLTNQEEWEICVEESTLRNSSKDSALTIELKLYQKEECPQEGFCELSLDKCETENLKDWNLVDSQTDISMIQENKTPEMFSSQMQEEPIKPEETVPKFNMKTDQDILMNVDIKGTPEDLERIRNTFIHKFAPMAGFEVESSRIEINKPEADSSFMNASQVSNLSNQMRDEIEELIEKKFKSLSANSLSKAQESKVISCGNYNHGWVTCDNCRQRIIGCARYKSLVKPDFDLCETCEATGCHPEPLIKIRTPLVGGIGMKLNAHFETLKNLISENPTKVCPYAQRKQEEKKAENAPVTQPNFCHIRKTSAAMVETPQVTLPCKPQKPSLCHIRPTANLGAAQPRTLEGKCKETFDHMTNLFPGVDQESIKTLILANPSADNSDMANMVIDCLITRN